jgi:drug/metabolite transporter (DMT)-like permease
MDAVPFLFFAILTACLDNLGNGLQKGGSRWFESGPRGLLRGQGWAAFLTWVTGILMCIAAPFVLGFALTRGPATIAAALGVFGLVPLYLYASLALKERITSFHAAALALIVAGTMFLAWKSLSLALPASRFSSDRLLIILLVSFGATLLWSGVALWRRSPYVGFALGVLTGLVGGLNLLVLKLGAIFSAWWATAGLWIALSTANFFLLQLAYVKSTALQVVPSNTAIAVLFPMLVAPVIFAEPMPLWLILGTLPSFAAIALLGLGERQARLESGSPDVPEG